LAEIFFYAPSPVLKLGSFFGDFDKAVLQAADCGDNEGVQRLESLLVDYVYTDMQEMRFDKSVRYFESRSVWKHFNATPVYKSVDLPCIAFTGFYDKRSHRSEITVLAACYKYPNDSDLAWWQEVVLPRVRSIS
jgi:hypothetical protein